MPRINEATIRLLTRLGVEVVVSAGAGCCGALNHHIGQHDRAMALARANIEAWSREPDLDAVIINASGCGTTVKDYGFMFRTEPEPWRATRREDRRPGGGYHRVPVAVRLCPDPRATRPDGRLSLRLQPAARPAGHRRTEDAAGARRLPRRRTAGSRISAAGRPAPTICCSRRSPAACAPANWATSKPTKPDLIAAGNIGCITQLSGDAVPVVHTVELLDWMAGGPRPPGVPG